MDNVTHSLAGVVIGQAAAQSSRERARLRLPLWIASALANNLPDLDLLYSGVTGGRLGYLLHHRGHTHTVAMAAPQTALVLLGVYIWVRMTRQRLSKDDWKWFAAVSALGPLMHIALDFGNSYGVHPFWPAVNEWFYGDAVFIAEPLLWTSLLPAVIAGSSSRLGKSFFGALLALAVGACWFSGLVPWQMSLIVTASGLWFLGLMQKVKVPAQAWSSLAASLAVVVLFFAVSARARAQIKEGLAKNFPDSTVHQLALSPLPANPFCWHFFATQSDGERIVSRRGTFAPFPHMFPASDCPEFRFKTAVDLLKPVPAPPRPELLWAGQFTASRTELDALAKDCFAAAALRFIRIPFWTKTEGRIALGDLRFERGEKGGFARLEIPNDRASRNDCPRFVPPWGRPLGGLAGI